MRPNWRLLCSIRHRFLPRLALLTSSSLPVSRCDACGRGRRWRPRTGRPCGTPCGIPALLAEVDAALAVLDAPSARLIANGEERPIRLAEVEDVLTSDALVVDACRHAVRDADTMVSLATRPVLFALARALG